MQRPNTTRISVVIPAYNCAEFIGAAIESVLEQTHPADEIVVVDDGSTDGTTEIVERYAGAGVRLVRQQNQGAGAARNRGIRETSGAYLAFLDGDDLWLPRKLELQHAFLEQHPEIAMVGCDYWLWNAKFDKRTLERSGVRPGKDLQREIVVHNRVGNPSMILIRRSVIERHGMFDPTLRWAQDWEFFIRIVANEQVAFIHEPLMTYRWHFSGLTNTNAWERLSVVDRVARQAIRRYRPRHEQPLLLLRAYSQSHYDRGVYAVRYRWPLRRRLGHAARAMLYPFDDTRLRLKLVGRAILGERLNRHSRREAAGNTASLATRQD